jgi:hypothetical protein
MVTGQGVLSRTFDVGASDRVEARLADREAVRGQVHAGALRDVLELHRINGSAGFEFNTVAQVALVLGCSEHRAGQLLGDALGLEMLPGALEALECGLLAVEQSRVLVSATDPLPVEQRVRVWERLQDRLLADLEQAVVRPPARLGELLRRYAIEADPAAATERRKSAEADGSVGYRRRSPSAS